MMLNAAVSLLIVVPTDSKTRLTLLLLSLVLARTDLPPMSPGTSHPYWSLPPLSQPPTTIADTKPHSVMVDIAHGSGKVINLIMMVMLPR
jgi:hypothetical protein